MKKKLLGLFMICVAFILIGCSSPLLEPVVTYSVSYNGNENISGIAPVDSTSYTSGSTVTVLGNTGTMAKIGEKFIGWTESSDGIGTIFSGQQTFSIDSNKTFYAKWIDNATPTFTITYDGNTNNAGSIPVDENIYINSQIATISGNTGNLSKDNYALTGWNTLADGTGTSYNVGDDYTISGNITFYAVWNRVFRAQKITDNSWYDCVTQLLATGTNCIVYAETSSGITEASAISIAAEFDTNIYGKILTNFGTASDVDANGKIIILLLDIQDGYSGSGGYVAGYYDPTHVYNKATYPNSNLADMLFMDVNPAIVASTAFYGTLAHEFQHLVNYNNTVLKDDNAQDLWINEGLSSGAEYVYSASINTGRVSYYNDDPIGTIRNGNNFFVWNGYWESPSGGGDVLADYATVYLFFQWLRIHASNGTLIYKEILDSISRDYSAVTAAANLRINASFNDWSVLLETWMLANILGENAGYKGYLNTTGLTKTDFSKPEFNSLANAKAYLSPGEGIVSQMPTGGTNTVPTVPPSGANVKYVGINTSTGVLVKVSPYTGDVSLVYNGNSDYLGADEIGYVANIAFNPLSSNILSIEADSTPPPTSYPIDVQLTPGGNLTSDSHSLQKTNVNEFKGKR